MKMYGTIYRSYVGYDEKNEKCEYVWEAFFDGPNKRESVIYDRLPSDYEIVSKWEWCGAHDFSARFEVNG